ncbi:MAG: tRNA (guanosine(46)-N7)-methyltransferase TrmB [Rhodobacteraceae bacterium]|nr:tRNA (guanosine(46)-N7)-methyltransferase TrmB [Paracoccaceae bacterium]
MLKVKKAGISNNKPSHNFYGKRLGKKLRNRQREYLEVDLKQRNILNFLGKTPEGTKWLDLAKAFPGMTAIWLEIGFGSGEHLIHQAKANPNVGLIGCEVYLNGVASLLGKLREEDLDNILLYQDDIRSLFPYFTDQAIERVFVLYPDPWPKKKHHRRRFVTPEHLIPLAKIMKPGARLRIATDISDYARQAVEQLNLNPHFEWEAEAPSDWKLPWKDWQSTRYEKKALLNSRVPIYLTFRRV